MACAHRSLSTLNYATRTNSTLSAPSGIANNDILVILFSMEGADTPGWPSGFSQWFDSGDYRQGAEISHFYGAWKRASSESGDYTITHPSHATQAYMCAISGAVRTGTPEDPAPTVNTGSDQFRVADGLTTTVDGNLIIYAFSGWNDQDATSPPVGTTPTFTERYEDATNLIYVADGVLTTAGATGDKSVTINNDDWSAVLVSVEAAVGTRFILT